MPYARRRRWIESATGTETIRGAATEIGVTHVTVSRWIKSGIPVGVLNGLIVKFGCDPIEAMVVWGFLLEADIPRLNFEAMVKYVPVEVLAAEVARRAAVYSETRPDSERKTSVGMLRRA